MQKRRDFSIWNPVPIPWDGVLIFCLRIVPRPALRSPNSAATHLDFRLIWWGDKTVRPAVYDVYQMKADRLPDSAKAVWLRTWPGEQPDLDEWSFVGRERHPSKWTIAEMSQRGFCYLEIPSWMKHSRSRSD